MMSNCMLCGKCTMVCPRGINTRHLILSICRIYDKEEKK
jgi:Fe-S oxidoreductase